MKKNIINKNISLLFYRNLDLDPSSGMEVSFSACNIPHRAKVFPINTTTALSHLYIYLILILLLLLFSSSLPHPPPAIRPPYSTPPSPIHQPHLTNASPNLTCTIFTIIPAYPSHANNCLFTESPYPLFPLMDLECR